ncbi:pyridoxamine 5'-phosphate oxidase family protein, partial [Nostoc sp. NIES-2111]
MSTITTVEDLRAHYGAISPLAERKVLRALDHHCAAFIRLSPFLVIATGDAHGHLDASPRGDAPGFVKIIDETMLLIPDRRGNNRVDSFSNLLGCPGVGLLFFVPGLDETLRVNGTAKVTLDEVLLAGTDVDGKAPRAGTLVSVDEVFFQCGKALKRSKLWSGEYRVERKAFPSLGKIISEQT